MQRMVEEQNPDPPGLEMQQLGTMPDCRCNSRSSLSLRVASGLTSTTTEKVLCANQSWQINNAVLVALLPSSSEIVVRHGKESVAEEGRETAKDTHDLEPKIFLAALSTPGCSSS